MFDSTSAVTFHDATQGIRDALADPAMREKVARVRAEMDLEDAREVAIRAIDDLCEKFRKHGPWAAETFHARGPVLAAVNRLHELSVYRPELRG